MKMRKSLVLTAYILCLSLVAGVMVLKVPSIAFGIGVTLDIHPETLNLKSNGVITAFIELPDPYNVSDIDIDTIKLHVKDAGDWVVPIRCIIADGKLIAKFDASNVADHILGKLVHMQIIPPQAKYTVDLVVEGMVKEEHFEGSDTIRVIYKD